MILDRWRQRALTRRRRLLAPNDGLLEQQKLATALILVAMVTVAGTFGFVEIEGWNVWRSFYFTLITITTVGYGDEGLSDEGKKFAILLLVGGVISASYTFATIVSSSVTSQLAWRKRMNKEIRRIEHHTIVCGFGRLGASVCEKLARRGRPFVVIDRDPVRFAKATELGYLAVEGAASEHDVLVEAGLERADHVVAAVDSFADNVVITMEARDCRPNAMVIARAERESDIRRLERAGATRVLCPFQSGGRETVEQITNPRVAEFLVQASLGGRITLGDVRIRKGSPLVGMTLAEFGKGQGDRISFVALEREDESEAMIPPRGGTTLQTGDHLIVAGDPQQIAGMNDLAGGATRAA